MTDDNNQNEWLEEVNQWGGVRRYRKSPTGGKEYEMTINDIPESELEDYNKRQREAKERFYAENQRRMAAQNDQNPCLREECALFVGDTCIFARRQVTEVRETVGKRCPFSIFNGKCTDKCVLNKNGGCVFLQEN